jgi:archaellum component FlaC
MDKRLRRIERKLSLLMFNVSNLSKKLIDFMSKFENANTGLNAATVTENPLNDLPRDINVSDSNGNTLLDFKGKMSDKVDIEENKEMQLSWEQVLEKIKKYFSVGRFISKYLEEFSNRNK